MVILHPAIAHFLAMCAYCGVFANTNHSLRCIARCGFLSIKHRISVLDHPAVCSSSVALVNMRNP